MGGEVMVQKMTRCVWEREGGERSRGIFGYSRVEPDDEVSVQWKKGYPLWNFGS